MARRPTGQIVERSGRRGTVYAIRFRAYGKRWYVTLGTADQGWNRARAEVELANILADVRRGIWQPAGARAEAELVREDPTFHVFASEWFAAREAEGLAPKTITDLKWSLSCHLLPHFADHRLTEITPRAVDQYKLLKVRERTAIDAEREAAHAKGEKFSERGLSNGSINHTLRHLAQVLETAVEYGLIDSNPASGRRRRLRTAPPPRPWVEPEQLMALLASCAGVGRMLVALLAGSGLRIGEALALRWENVDLGTGSLHVLDAKTPKGLREVHLTPALREELTLWRHTTAFSSPENFVIHTSSGRRHHPSNLRRDVLAPAVKRANLQLTRAGISPIGPITFHSLRRTYASLRCACGDDVRYTADQLGHEDPRFTLRVYAQAVKRRDRLARPHLEAFDRALEWAQLGTGEPLILPAGDPLLA